MKPGGFLKSSIIGEVQNTPSERALYHTGGLKRVYTPSAGSCPSIAACTCKDNFGRPTAQVNFLVPLSSHMPEYPDDFLFSYLITVKVTLICSGRKWFHWDQAPVVQMFLFP